MAQLSTKIKLYCEANSKVADFQNNVILQDDSDGKGSYIKTWSISGLAKPTDEQLASYEADADKQEQNNQVVATRVSLYGTPAEQLEILVEQGLDKLIERNDKIKADNPKV